MSYKLTTKDKNLIKDNMTILYADNEQKIDHIIFYLDKAKVKHKALKGMHIGDWSFKIKALPELGIIKTFYGYKHFTIERKNSVEELSGCLSDKTKRANLDREFTRATLKKYKFMLMVEDPDGYEKICKGNYNTNYNRYAFMTSLLGVYLKYNIPYIFINRECSGHFILKNFMKYIKYYIEDRIYKSNRN